MSEAKMDSWMRENGFKLDADEKMVPAVSGSDGWRELAFAPMPKGMLAFEPRDRKKGLQAADVPDCSIPLPSVKAELLRFIDHADIKTPGAAVKWRMVYEAANLDSRLLDGVTDELARRCTIRAILHLLVRFSTFVKASEGKMSYEEVAQKVDAIFEQTSAAAQAKNVKHALRLDRAERDKAKKNPGGQPKGEVRDMKAVMRAIQCKKVAYVKGVPGVDRLIEKVRKDYAEGGKDIPWKTRYLCNQFSRWDPIKDDFREKPAHGS